MSHAIDEALARWHPGSITLRGTLAPEPAAELAGLLDLPAPRPGQALAPMWHEVYLRESTAAADLGADGHPAESPLVPPVAERRRVFASTAVTVHRPLVVGTDVVRVATVERVRVVDGRRGPLLLVEERHIWSGGGTPRIVEDRTIAYRSGAGRDVVAGPVADDHEPDPPVLQWRPTQQRLAAYSRLTGNAHRIHVDEAYARDVEGHPGLVVHGPLLALLAGEAVRTSIGAVASRLQVRLVAPAASGAPVLLTTATSEDGSVAVVGRSAGRVVLHGTAAPVIDRGLRSAVTWLFVPGDRPERHGRALQSGAEVVVLDLEDAVPPARKAAARAASEDTLAAGAAVVLRINGVGTPWHDADLALAVAHSTPVMLPKVEDPHDIARLRDAGVRGVVGLVESPAGLLAAPAIAQACDRLAFGSVDLAAALGVAADDREVLAPARMTVVVASAAAGLPAPVDGVTTQLRDQDLTRADARAAVRAGFGGKLCVHPDQLVPVVQGFAPTTAELAWARRVLDRADAGASAVHGELVDPPVLIRARAVVERAAGAH